MIAAVHTHRFRVDERPVDGRYHGVCSCSTSRTFPIDPGLDFNVKRPASINGIPYFMRPFEWGSAGLIKGQRDRDYTRKDHDQDDDSE